MKPNHYSSSQRPMGVYAELTRVSRWLKMVVLVTALNVGNGVQAADFARGLILPSEDEIKREAAEIGRQAAEILELDRQARDEFQRFGPGSKLGQKLTISGDTVRNKAFDWSAFIPMEVKDQKQCGSCWVFGAVGAFEANYFLRNGTSISASEQYLLDASLRFGCGGGWSIEPLTFLMTTGTARSQDYPYVAVEGELRSDIARPYKALVWGFVGNGLNPTRQELKEALVAHGPLAIGAFTSTSGWKDHKNTDTIIKEENADLVNHVITLVGWDDNKNAWRIKNSWGNGWGNNGFAWVDYDTDMIGYFALWVEAIRYGYKLPAEYRNAVDAVGKGMKEAVDKVAEGRKKFEPVTERVFTPIRKFTDVFPLDQGTFDEDILGFHVKLENGTARTENQQTAIAGKVSVWLVADPGTCLTFSDAAFTVSRSGNAATGFNGDGKLSASVQGQTVALGDAATAGCTAQGQLTGNGTLRAHGQTLNMAYKLAAGAGLAADGRWYGGDCGWIHAGNVPLGVDYHVQNPRLEVQLRNAAVTVKLGCDKVEAQTQAKNSVNNKPWAYAQINPELLVVPVNGTIQLPLPSLLDPGDVNLGARDTCKNACAALPSGDKPTLPELPSTPDRNYFPPGPLGDAAYEEAMKTYNSAKSKYDDIKSKLDEWNKKVDAHNECVKGCDGLFPKPPSIPRLPASISVRVEEVIR